MKPESEQPQRDAPKPASRVENAMSRRRFLAVAGASGALLLLPGASGTAFAARLAPSGQPGASVRGAGGSAFSSWSRDSSIVPA